MHIYIYIHPVLVAESFCRNRSWTLMMVCYFIREHDYQKRIRVYYRVDFNLFVCID